MTIKMIFKKKLVKHHLQVIWNTFAFESLLNINEYNFRHIYHQRCARWTRTSCHNLGRTHIWTRRRSSWINPLASTSEGLQCCSSISCWCISQGKIFSSGFLPALPGRTSKTSPQTQHNKIGNFHHEFYVFWWGISRFLQYLTPLFLRTEMKTTLRNGWEKTRHLWEGSHGEVVLSVKRLASWCGVSLSLWSSLTAKRWEPSCFCTNMI